MEKKKHIFINNKNIKKKAREQNLYISESALAKINGEVQQMILRGCEKTKIENKKRILDKYL